jgi:hypothetical protein
MIASEVEVDFEVERLAKPCFSCDSIGRQETALTLQGEFKRDVVGERLRRKAIGRRRQGSEGRKRQRGATSVDFGCYRRGASGDGEKAFAKRI